MQSRLLLNVRNPSASLVLVGFCLGYRLVDLPFLDQTSQLFSAGRLLLCSTDENVRELIDILLDVTVVEDVYNVQVCAKFLSEIP